MKIKVLFLAATVYACASVSVSPDAGIATCQLFQQEKDTLASVQQQFKFLQANVEALQAAQALLDSCLQKQKGDTPDITACPDALVALNAVDLEDNAQARAQLLEDLIPYSNGTLKADDIGVVRNPFVDQTGKKYPGFYVYDTKGWDVAKIQAAIAALKKKIEQTPVFDQTCYAEQQSLSIQAGQAENSGKSVASWVTTVASSLVGGVVEIGAAVVIYSFWYDIKIVLAKRGILAITPEDIIKMSERQRQKLRDDPALNERLQEVLNFLKKGEPPLSPETKDALGAEVTEAITVLRQSFEANNTLLTPKKTVNEEYLIPTRQAGSTTPEQEQTSFQSIADSVPSTVPEPGEVALPTQDVSESVISAPIESQPAPYAVNYVASQPAEITPVRVQELDV